jgi:GTP-binding protein HflX
VGYTNAGKSTLFNRLTAGGAFADPMLFATLATRVERWELGGGNAAMLSDTVGFIRDLPHHLIASFRSTLEETVNAHMLIIVLDISDHNAPMHLQTVNRTLDEIGATEQPRLIVLNKVDRITKAADLLVWLNRHPAALAVSASTGEGLAAVRDVVREAMLGGMREVEIAAALADSRTITLLEQRTEVVNRDYSNGQACFTVRIGRRQVDQLLAQGARFMINGLEPGAALKLHWDGPALRPAPRIPPHQKV